MLGGASSPLLFTCSATQLLKHFPLAEIVLFHQHTESSLGPGLFRGILAYCSNDTDTSVQVVATWTACTVSVSLATAIQTAGIASFTAFVSTFSGVIKVITTTAGQHTSSIFHKVTLCAVYTGIYSSTLVQREIVRRQVHCQNKQLHHFRYLFLK